MDKVLDVHTICLKSGKDFKMKGSKNVFTFKPGVNINTLQIDAPDNEFIFEKDVKVNDINMEASNSRLDFVEDISLKTLNIIESNNKIHFKNGKIENLSVTGNNTEIISKTKDLKIENLSVGGENTTIEKAVIDSLKISGLNNNFTDCSY